MQTLIGWIAKPLGIFLMWIYDIVGSYGLSIIIFTVIVKLLLYPLYVMQMKFTAKMGLIQPKMKELQSRYANDKETLKIGRAHV